MKLPRFSLGLLLSGVLVAEATAQCRDDLDEAAGYTIRSVRVEGRWVPRLPLPIAPGDRFSNAGVQTALRAVQQALHAEERRGFELQNLGALGVTYISPCLLAEGRQVDVLIEVRSVRVDLLEIGGNILPLPRSGFATFYQAVPAPLRALHPQAGAYYDKEYGFAPTGAIAVDLLRPRPDGLRLQLNAGGRKSVQETFYDAGTELALSRLHPGETLERLSVSALFESTEAPRGPRTLRRTAGKVGAGARFRPASGWSFSLDGEYRYGANEFAGAGRTTEHALGLRLGAEGRAGGGFLRAALWAEAAAPGTGSDYGRAAGLVAFAREIPVAAGQTIGLEAILGGGKAWSAPAYARFFGGHTERNFLYDALDSRALAAFPEGPLLRSQGEGQAQRGERGTRAYWHLNLNLALPVPGLSRPLIPDEEVAPGLSLKRLLKNKAGDSVAFYAADLEEQGMSPEAAMVKARQTYSEVQPAIAFIADRAKVYALKPLFLADFAGSEGEPLEVAVGGGLQLTVVIARMELGYLQTVAGSPSKSGNLFARITFENIF